MSGFEKKPAKSRWSKVKLFVAILLRLCAKLSNFSRFSVLISLVCFLYGFYLRIKELINLYLYTTNWPLLTIESPVAQWLEHPARSRRVVGSNPIK